jgi:hypothetical protein
MMAGDQPPQLAFDDDRYAHRRTHAHVLQIFDVNRRNAAQHAITHVDRRLAIASHQRHRHVAYIGDDAQGIEDIQATGLRGNIAGRIALAQVGRECGQTIFGHHLAAAVCTETVSHHAVEAGERAHLRHGYLQ